MARFIAGLVFGGLIVGACWYSNRLAYDDLRGELLATYELAAQLRALESERKKPASRPDEVFVDGRPESDPDAPWVDLPPAEITAKERAELVKRLEARGGPNPFLGPAQ